MDKQENNLLVTRSVLEDYINLYKGIGFKSLCNRSKIPFKTLNGVKYCDIDKLSSIDVLKLARGLKSIKKKFDNNIDVMVKKLEDLVC